MDTPLPNPQYAYEPEFRWPCAKFRLPAEDLFTTLHDRFNIRPSRIQDPFAFHRDAVECGDASNTLEEFYDKLGQRKAERLKEINDAWFEVGCVLGLPWTWRCPSCKGHEQSDSKQSDSEQSDSEQSDSDTWEDDRAAALWGAFVLFCRNMSLDRMVMFFDEFARDEREKQSKKSEELRRLCDESRPVREKAPRQEAEVNNSGHMGSATSRASDSNTPQQPETSEAQPPPPPVEPCVSQLETEYTQTDTQTDIPIPTSTRSSRSEDLRRARKRSYDNIKEAEEDIPSRRKVSRGLGMTDKMVPGPERSDSPSILEKQKGKGSVHSPLDGADCEQQDMDDQIRRAVEKQFPSLNQHTRPSSIIGIESRRGISSETENAGDGRGELQHTERGPPVAAELHDARALQPNASSGPATLLGTSEYESPRL